MRRLAFLSLIVLIASPSRGVAEPSVADKARTVLDAHCARCHQSGRTAGPATDRFGNILDLDEIAQTSRLVAPGRPDASLLYQRMLGRHAPLDVFSAAPEGKGPTGAEIEAVRDWIESLPAGSAHEPQRRAPVAAVAAETASAIDLAVWTDKEFYRAGDLAAFFVSASVPCHLTLISVGGDGQAVVLFPNDLERDNLIGAGGFLRVPGAHGAYQLRFDREGTETVIAICQRTRRHPEGMRPDYEKERFTILGDWRTFLRTLAEREAEDDRKPRRRSRGKSDGDSPPVDADGPAIEGRAAITIQVQEPAMSRGP